MFLQKYEYLLLCGQTVNVLLLLHNLRHPPPPPRAGGCSADLRHDFSSVSLFLLTAILVELQGAGCRVPSDELSIIDKFYSILYRILEASTVAARLVGVVGRETEHDGGVQLVVLVLESSLLCETKSECCVSKNFPCYCGKCRVTWYANQKW